MIKEEIDALIRKNRDGLATPREKRLLYKWYEAQMSRNAGTPYTMNLVKEEAVYKMLIANIRKKTEAQTKPPRQSGKVKKLWPRLAVAASVVIAITATTYFFEFWPGRKDQVGTVIVNDVDPGSNQAALILSTGKRINLNDAKNGDLANDAGIQITKSADGQVSYNLVSTQAKIAANAAITIETPKGGKYQLVLPDQSKVWLNAATTIRVPANFSLSKERIVSLDGEAYFEVSKDKAHPFIVKSNTQEVRVLGTHFNINNYQDEPIAKTTLVEGSVQVKTIPANARPTTFIPNESILSPGQQSQTSNGSITVSKADLKDDLAWKDGYFILHHDTFRGIMNKLSRWYNVEVVYETNPDEIHLGGIISSSQKLSAVLRLMDKTGKVHFKLEGRRLTVTN